MPGVMAWSSRKNRRRDQARFQSLRTATEETSSISNLGVARPPVWAANPLLRPFALASLRPCVESL